MFASDDDYDMDAEMARFLADIEAGREKIPEPAETGPAFSLGEACDVDPMALGLLCGPDGLDGFTQDEAADAMPPGPVLSALAEQAVANAPGLTDNQLFGALATVRRLRGRADYLQAVTVAEFTRRRDAQLAASVARKDPPGRRPGEQADAELGFYLVTSADHAGNQMDMAASLAARLPRTLAGMAAGAIDHDRAYYVWFYTRFLSDADAARADEILAAAAPDLRLDQLGRKAAALEIKLDPEAAAARKEHARKEGQRVEARREASGNMSLAGRELAIADALAAKAQLDADAAALRAGGVEGTLDRLRSMSYTDRLSARDPMARIPGRPPGDQGSRPHPDENSGGTGDGPEGDGDGPDGPGGGPDGPGGGPGAPGGGGVPAPLPALINLLIPVGTLLGWSSAPGEAGSWGLLDPDDTRTIVEAASRHPGSRWCITVVGPDGTAVEHGCARGQHPWTPEPTPPEPRPPEPRPPENPPEPRPPENPRQEPGPAGPDDRQQAQLAALLRALNVTLNPIARETCDHRNAEDRYRPSRKLRDLVRARTAMCPARGCGAQAYHADLDHTVPYPAGPTDECNLSPPCRRHHRCKQAPGWKLEQPEPGVMRWTLPSGRVYTTTPTVYDL